MFIMLRFNGYWNGFEIRSCSYIEVFQIFALAFSKASKKILCTVSWVSSPRQDMRLAQSLWSIFIAFALDC